MLRSRFAALALVAAVCIANLTPAARAELVRIAVQPGLSMLPIWVAEKEGLFVSSAKRHGSSDLQLEVRVFTGSNAINDAMISDNVDFGVGSIPGLLIAWDKITGQSEIRGLCGVAIVRFGLFVNRPDIKTLADLKEGEQISVPSLISPQAIVLRYAAEKALGSAKRAENLMISMPHSTAVTALLSGSGLVGSFSTPPYSQILKASPKVHQIFSSVEMLDGKDATGVLLAGNRRYVDAHPRIAQAMVDAIVEAIELIQKDPLRAADIYLKSDPAKLSREEVKTLITDDTTRYQAEPEGVMVYARLLKQQGLIKNEPKSWSDLFFGQITKGN